MRTIGAEALESQRESGRTITARATVCSCQRPILSRQEVADDLAKQHEFRKLGRLAEVSIRAQGVHFGAVAA